MMLVGKITAGHVCPVCGRRLRMPQDLLGKAVTCLHCKGSFVTGRPTGQQSAQDVFVEEDNLLARADTLLAAAEDRLRSTPRRNVEWTRVRALKH